MFYLSIIDCIFRLKNLKQNFSVFFVISSFKLENERLLIINNKYLQEKSPFLNHD